MVQSVAPMEQIMLETKDGLSTRGRLRLAGLNLKLASHRAFLYRAESLYELFAFCFAFFVIFRSCFAFFFRLFYDFSHIFRYLTYEGLYKDSAQGLP